MATKVSGLTQLLKIETPTKTKYFNKNWVSVVFRGTDVQLNSEIQEDVVTIPLVDFQDGAGTPITTAATIAAYLGGLLGNLAGEFDSLQFSTDAAVTVVEGQMAWNATDGTVDLGMVGGNVTQQIGQETFFHVKAGENLVDGDVVYASGAVGNSGQIVASKFLADGNTKAFLILGVATETILSGSFGFITKFGKVRGLDTSAFTLGDILYPSPTVAGALTNVQPISPDVEMPIAFVVNSHAINGSIAVRLTPPNELAELHDVHFTEPLAAKQIIVYSTVDGHWNNETISSLFDAGANITVAEHADNAAAITAGLLVGDLYRTADLLKIVH